MGGRTGLAIVKPGNTTCMSMVINLQSHSWRNVLIMMIPEKAKVHFLAPVSTKIPPNEKVKEDYPVVVHGNHFLNGEIPEEDMKKIVAHIEKEGFGKGAVVVKRDLGQRDYKNPFNWGIVFFLNKHKHNNEEPYRPIGVKWINSPIGTQTFYTMAELYVIYPPYDDSEFEIILNSQENEVDY